MQKNRDIARFFSKGAPIYREKSEVHRCIAAHLLPQLTGLSATRILDAGCGTGFLTAHLKSLFPKAVIDALDISPHMLHEAQNHLGSCGQIRWIAADLWDHKSESPYDLIASSSSFQWIQPLPHLFSLLRALLKPGGSLVFSILTEGTLKELRQARLEAAPLKPLRNNLPSAAETRMALLETGFSIQFLGSGSFYEHFTCAEEMLASIKARGFTGGVLSSADAPLSRRELKDLCAVYDTKFRTQEGNVPASYEALFVRAVTQAYHPRAAL